MTGPVHYVVKIIPNPAGGRTEALIRAHVAFLRKLDAEKRLVLAGPFEDAPGGMIVLNAADAEEARGLAESDPFVAEGGDTVEVSTWRISCEENNHLGMG